MLAGHRGEIQWKKPKFTGGGGRRNYDAYRAIGLIFPIVLLNPLHTFDWGQWGESAMAIPLRSDRGFKLRAYLHDWTGLRGRAGLYLARQ